MQETPDGPGKKTSGLPDLIRSLLAAFPAPLPEEVFSGNEEIYAENSEGSDFFFVLEGSVQALRQTPLGSQEVARLHRGDLCGEVSVIDGSPRSVGIRALTAGRLLRFDALRLARVFEEKPEIETLILKIFCHSLTDKIRQANAVMSAIMSAEGESRRTVVEKRGTEHRVDGETKRSLLREHGMPTEDLEALVELMAGRHFDAGDAIFFEGDTNDSLYIVAEGRVRISRHLPGMGEEALAILQRGDVFGEMAWIDAVPRSADAIAHTGGSTVLSISRADLDGVLGMDPIRHRRFLKLICRVLCGKLRRMNDQLVAYRTMAFF